VINVGAALLSLGLRALLDRLRRSAPSPCLSAHVVEGSSNRRLTPDRADGVRHRAADYGHSADPWSNAASIRQSHYAYAYNHGNRQNVTSWWVGTKCADVLNGRIIRAKTHFGIEMWRRRTPCRNCGVWTHVSTRSPHTVAGTFRTTPDAPATTAGRWAACSSRTGRRSPGRRAHRPSLRTSVGEAEHAGELLSAGLPKIQKVARKCPDCDWHPGLKFNTNKGEMLDQKLHAKRPLRKSS
jgi:hypothetical protein